MTLGPIGTIKLKKGIVFSIPFYILCEINGQEFWLISHDPWWIRLSNLNIVVLGTFWRDWMVWNFQMGPTKFQNLWSNGLNVFANILIYEESTIEILLDSRFGVFKHDYGSDLDCGIQKIGFQSKNLLPVSFGHFRCSSAFILFLRFPTSDLGRFDGRNIRIYRLPPSFLSKSMATKHEKSTIAEKSEEPLAPNVAKRALMKFSLEEI